MVLLLEKDMEDRISPEAVSFVIFFRLSEGKAALQ